ncbi:hypothetical protein HHK36_000868 [Tetracentron sinense]|uniref:Protein FLX-like 2 n=1 Tax=Tetracentron sinense TaxID=13715 RepID=A0A835A1S4_TETSI|nr:hypothetical protein HHK36_000868 [Tetracentron sinense]
MGSKGHVPPLHLRRPLPGPGMMHSDPFGPPDAFPPFDMSPPPEVMEQKHAAEHVEIQRITRDNQRIAAAHATLRQELAAAQLELHRVQAQIGAMKTEREQHMRGVMDKIAKMEADLQATELMKLELQQARVDAQSLTATRQELISKVQQLTQDLQRTHSDVQQIPALMSELEGLRQEYQQCRATYGYEKKLYNNHLESLQMTEKNYITIAKEVETLRAELACTANLERRTGGPDGSTTGYKENEASGHGYKENEANEASGYGYKENEASGHGYKDNEASGHGYKENEASGDGYKENEASGHHIVGQNTYEDGYGVPQVGADTVLKLLVLPGYDKAGGPEYDAPRGDPDYDASLKCRWASRTDGTRKECTLPVLR